MVSTLSGCSESGLLNADLRTGLMMINQLHHPKMFGELVYKKT